MIGSGDMAGGKEITLGFQFEEDHRGGVERQAREEVQRGRHNWRSEEACCCPDWNLSRADQDPEVVHHLRGPHYSQGLRNSRRHGTRTLLQLIHAFMFSIFYK
ncbi:hypothetical protein LOK49_LG15G01636 [Camellia lanceoleosa]|uniref:Uncharacterized protein n=1 Tax=Camellia lanceoleosa TaxID=1840588 RepID=A0ACC0F8H9_9ERIC|nr:hypothetical protein LOK49_LG15G01636 [Camellia lanceoleosa]